MFPLYTVQTMSSNTSSRSFLISCAVSLSVITQSRTTTTKSRNNISFANVQNPPFDDRRLSVIFLQNNNEMLSFAKRFSFKVEGMCLQHLPTLSLKGNEPDGFANRRKSWQIETPFFPLVKRAARPSLNRM